MPELPDVTVYIEALRERTLGQPLLKARLSSPFVLRTFEPPLRAAEGRRVAGIERLGKRIVLRLASGEGSAASGGDLFLVIHLMIAGRLRWLEGGAKIPGKLGLAAFDFPAGTLILTEAATKKRASLHVLSGEEALRAMDRGGIEPLEASLPAFRAALVAENHTLKRALTDPTLFSGIGNAYSDEILHRARLSPAQLTRKLDDGEIARLHAATQEVLAEWTQRLREEAAGKFPEKVTAFRPQMAVHGKYRKPCPVCGTAVQRIAYADNETNYCPRCQTEGRLLSDRSLARLLKSDWPRSIEELEEKMPSRAPAAAK
ncbi:MAG TPA: DNA-formamidopyrimidine glycosylase family protein [Myxococcales bacterium]|nr:DNA-formamidopyrimidine glycosylase family protein [Myxococcales bacterium]